MALDLHSDLKILIVDDMAMIRQAIILHLKPLGLTNTTQATNGENAWDIITSKEENNESFELIFLDINMPKCNGIEFLRKVRSNPSFEKIPIIMLTTENEKDIVMAAIQAGANDYILKPFTGEIIEEKLRVLRV